MKKASLVSFILTISLLVGGQKVFSSPKTINYGFVPTLRILAMGQHTPSPTYYTEGFCIKLFNEEFNSELRSDKNLKEYKIPPRLHTVINRGQEFGGVLRPLYQGLKDKKVDLICGARRAQTSSVDPDGVTFSDDFFKSEVKVVLISENLTLSKPSEIRTLQDVRKSIEGKGKIGILQGNESVGQVLKNNKIDFKTFPNHQTLIESMALGKIIGMSDDTLHVHEFIDYIKISPEGKKALKAYFILPSYSTQEDELVTYSFAFRNDELGLRLKNLVDNILQKSSHMTNNMTNIREEVNKMSGKLQTSSPNLSQNPSSAPLEPVFKFLTNIFNKPLLELLVKLFFYAVFPLAFIALIPERWLPNNAKNSVMEILTEVLKSWLKPN